MAVEEREFKPSDLFTPLTNKKAILWIVVIGFLVYFNALFGQFVGDDLTYIVNYPPIHTINILSTFEPNLFNIAGQYRPLTVIYFSVLHFLFGETAFFYHLLQVSLHIICAILIFIFFRRFLSAGFALFSSLIFLVHPINVESVANIAHSDSPLFFLFGMIALIVSTKDRLFLKDKILLSLLLLLSIFTKESGILFIALINVYGMIFRKKSIAIKFVISFLVIMLYLLVRFFIGEVDFSPRLLTPVADLTFYQRIIMIPTIIFSYLRFFFYPNILSSDQLWTVTNLNFSNYYFPLLVVSVFFLLLIFSAIRIFKFNRKSFKIFIVFLTWCVIGIAPYLQISPLDFTVADRWFYFPIVGLIGILTLDGQAFYRIKSYKKPLLFLGIIIISVLMIRTILRNMDWYDSLTLYSRDVKASENYHITMNLGLEFAKKGDYEMALKYLHRSVELRPYETNLQNLGGVYSFKGDIDSARKYIKMAFEAIDYKISPGHKHSLDTYVNYAKILVLNDSDPKAIPFVNNALNDYPKSSDLWLLLSIAKYNEGDREGAINAGERLRQIDYNLGNGLIDHIKSGKPFNIQLSDTKNN